MKDLVVAYEFGDPQLEIQALTHRSAGNRNNERLEFLGDGVLNFVIADELFKHFPNASEGDLSRQRARLVRKETLAMVARELGLGELLKLGVGEMRAGGHRRDSILGDAVEALIGAVYVDGGFEPAASLIRQWFGSMIADLPPAEQLKDSKTRLQEHLQSRGLGLPEYQLVSATGPDHAQVFSVACRVTKPSICKEGQGSSRRKAEQAAASAVLTEFAAKPKSEPESESKTR